MGLAMVEALGQGIGAPACQAAMVECTNEGERATGQGLVAAASSIGRHCRSDSSTFICRSWPEITFVIVAGVVFVLSLIATKLSGFKFRKSIREVLSYG